MNEFVGMVFAIVQVVNMTSGLRMVHITGMRDQVACEETLLGATEDDFDGRILVERVECVSRLPGDYMQAVLNMPISNTMIVSYEVAHSDGLWPARHIFYGVAKQWQSQAGCEMLAAEYRQFSDDVRCINGYE